MKIEDFDYHLPEELIAQKPAEKRDASRLLVVHRDTGKTEHRHFYDILEYLQPGDCLVLNNSKVLPARLFGTKEKTGAKVEFLLIKRIEGDIWETMVKPGKRLKPGDSVIFSEKPLLRAEEGSVAAPTAGLHFTDELLEQAKEKGVELVYVTLHVGIGTFRPVKCENIEEHSMHFEEYHISEESAEVINRAKREGRRIISVGTTSTRTVEQHGDIYLSGL